MKIHLSKSQSIPNTIFNSFTGFACSNNPFTKGPIFTRERFEQKIAQDGEKHICKHCLKIYNISK